MAEPTVNRHVEQERYVGMRQYDEISLSTNFVFSRIDFDEHLSGFHGIPQKKFAYLVLVISNYYLTRVVVLRRSSI